MYDTPVLQQRLGCLTDPLRVPLEVLDDRRGQDVGGTGSILGVLDQHACDDVAKVAAVLVGQRQFLTSKHTYQIISAY